MLVPLHEVGACATVIRYHWLNNLGGCWIQDLIGDLGALHDGCLTTVEPGPFNRERYSGTCSYPVHKGIVAL